MKYGQYLKNLRERAGVSRNRVRDTLGIAVQYLCDVEHERRAPFPPHTNRRLAQLFGLSQTEARSLLERAMIERGEAVFRTITYSDATEFLARLAYAWPPTKAQLAKLSDALEEE